MSKKNQQLRKKSRSDRLDFGWFFRPWGLLKTLTEDALKKFYRQIFSDFSGRLFCIFSALGFLEVLLGSLWIQKN